jgi:serine/threonine protein kinase KIN1/2
MASAAPSSPSVVRSASTSRRQQQSVPHRTQSTSVRSTATASATPHRTLSQSQAHTRTSSQQGNLTNVARRDFEQTNIAQPSSNGRSSSRDRAGNAHAPARADSTRSSNQAARPGHTRYSSDASTLVPPSTNGTAAPNRSVAGNSVTKGRRTMLETSTGQWALGKTIGAGSMGKVKLAKNVDTGEQVCTV